MGRGGGGEAAGAAEFAARGERSGGKRDRQPGRGAWAFAISTAVRSADGWRVARRCAGGSGGRMRSRTDEGGPREGRRDRPRRQVGRDRKSTRLNSSH